MVKLSYNRPDLRYECRTLRVLRDRAILQVHLIIIQIFDHLAHITRDNLLERLSTRLIVIWPVFSAELDGGSELDLGARERVRVHPETGSGVGVVDCVLHFYLRFLPEDILCAELRMRSCVWGMADAEV